MWTHALLFFLLGLALCSPLGAASYFLGQWFRRVQPLAARLADSVLALLGLVLINFYLVLVGPLCYGGALAKRQNEGRARSVFSYFVQLLGSTTLVLLIFYLVWMTLVFVFPTTYAAMLSLYSTRLAPATPAEQIGLWAGAMWGLMTVPAVIPIALWIWHTSKLRPGVDRLAVSNEALD